MRHIRIGRCLSGDRAPELGPVRNVQSRDTEFSQTCSPDIPVDFPSQRFLAEFYETFFLAKISTAAAVVPVLDIIYQLNICSVY